MFARTRSSHHPLVSFGIGFATCAALATAIASGPAFSPAPLRSSDPTVLTLDTPTDLAAASSTSDTLTITSEAFTAGYATDESAVFDCPPSDTDSNESTVTFDERDCFSTSHFCGSVAWEEFSINDLPPEVLFAAKESLENLDINEAYIGRMGPLTLFTLGGSADGHECALVITEQGTVLQADATTPGEAIPDELAGVLRDKFPDGKISKAGITQVVSFWAHVTTPDGRTYTVTFEPEEGLAVIDVDDNESFMAPDSDTPASPAPPAQTDATPDSEEND